MKDNLRIYGVKDSCIKYLSQYQEHLFLHEGGSSRRKYIGIVFEIAEVGKIVDASATQNVHYHAIHGKYYQR